MGESSGCCPHGPLGVRPRRHVAGLADVRAHGPPGRRCGFSASRGAPKGIQLGRCHCPDGYLPSGFHVFGLHVYLVGPLELSGSHRCLLHRAPDQLGELAAGAPRGSCGTQTLEAGGQGAGRSPESGAPKIVIPGRIEFEIGGYRNRRSSGGFPFAGSTGNGFRRLQRPAHRAAADAGTPLRSRVPRRHVL